MRAHTPHQRLGTVGTVAVLALGFVASGALLTRSAVANRPDPYPLDAVLRLQDVQLLGTHNSYHVRPTDRKIVPTEPANYAHPALDVQLSRQGVRSLELDVFDQPGLPVFHSIMVDQSANCPDLRSCLRTVNQWSRRNPGHLPVSVFVELKPPPTSHNRTVRRAINAYVRRHDLRKWDATAIGRVDRVVKEVFGRTLLKPDDVRGRHRTLRDAVVHDGWPTLGRVRGKVFVVLNAEEKLRDVYRKGAPSLQRRSMFVVSSPQDASAAVISRDEPNPAEFRRLVREHFLVRTRADAEGLEARDNDHARATMAFASGATMVATDYPVPDPAVNASFVVRLPGRVVARCNPVTAPKACTDSVLENPKALRERPARG